MLTEVITEETDSQFGWFGWVRCHNVSHFLFGSRLTYQVAVISPVTAGSGSGGGSARHGINTHLQVKTVSAIFNS